MGLKQIFKIHTPVKQKLIILQSNTINIVQSYLSYTEIAMAADNLFYLSDTVSTLTTNTLSYLLHTAWWRHQTETFSAWLAHCERNPPVIGGFPLQRPVMRNFDVFFDLRLNKRLSKQSRRRWFETPSRTLWCHCDESIARLPMACDGIGIHGIEYMVPEYTELFTRKVKFYNGHVDYWFQKDRMGPP